MAMATSAGAAAAAAAGADNTVDFKSRQEVIQLGGRLGLVCLDFPNTPNKVQLYAHAPQLFMCSGVLRNSPALALEGDEAEASVPISTPGQPRKVARSEGCSDVKSSGSMIIITLPDEDSLAWEEVLGLLYSCAGAKIDWSNMQRLLVLADKMDMQGITRQALGFLQSPSTCSRIEWVPGTVFGHSVCHTVGAPQTTTQLQHRLTASNVLGFLTFFSKLQLEKPANQCIAYVVAYSVSVPDAFFMSGVQPRQLQALFGQMRQAHKDDQTRHELRRARGW